MIPNISSPSFTSQANNNIHPRFVSLSMREDLEIRFSMANCPSKMEEIVTIQNERDFHMAFPHLTLKCQHLFRLLQNWSYLECFPSQTLLAKLVKCSRKHVNFMIKILTKSGFIIKNYRPRKTCQYMVRNFLKKLSWKDTEQFLKKDDFPPKVTPKVTLDLEVLTYCKKSISKKVKMRNKRRNRSNHKPEPPDWLPNWPMIKERFPTLAREIFEDKDIYTNLAAYTEHAVNKALESLERAQNKRGYINTSHGRYLFGALNKFVEKGKRNWRLAMSLRKQEKT